MDCSERNSVSLKMEAARSSETSEEINYPTRCKNLQPQNFGKVCSRPICKVRDGKNMSKKIVGKI